jgi:two-component system LytT family response regulator
MIRTLIVEDNQKSATFLKEFLCSLYCDIELIGVANTLDEAVALINGEKPKLVFLDINLNAESGFDIFDKTNSEKFEVIVTTSHSEYALKALKNSAVDYILKPYDAKDLKEAIAKARKKLEQRDLLNSAKSNTPEKFTDRIFISTLDGLICIKIEEIVNIEADSNYSVFYLANGSKIMSSKRLAIYEEMLISQSFVRVHKSSIVNLNHVTKYQRGRSGNLFMSNGTIIKVSENKKDELLKFFNV